MSPCWNQLSDDLQIALSREALRRATATIAVQAEVLADEIEAGGLADLTRFACSRPWSGSAARNSGRPDTPDGLSLRSFQS